MGVFIGLVIGIGSLLGGFMAMGGHVGVIWQPLEFVIIGGIALGTFIIANPMTIIKDAGLGDHGGDEGRGAEAGRLSRRCSGCSTR